MVPEIFAPTVSQNPAPMTPATGPWISPMRNHAPGELEQTGQTLEQAGGELAHLGNTIGDRVQETMDDGMTKSAETAFLKSALPVVGQYKTTQGMNATQQFDPTAKAITKARQDARATLTNPIQERMFDQVTNDHMVSFGQQMADHESVQRVQFGKQESADRVDNLNVLARMARLSGDMAGAQKYEQGADAETLNVAQLSGAGPDSPVAEAMLRAKRSDLAHGVVAGLLERHAVNEADDYFQKVQGNLDSRTAEVLDSAIKSAHRQEDPKIDGEKAIMSAKGATGPGVLQLPIPAGTITTTQGIDGIDIHAVGGTKVLAPASGTVTKVGIDEQRGRFAEIALSNGYTAKFSGLGAVNYEEGQRITIGQTLGLSGRDDNGQGVTHYAMTGPDGKFIDPRQASSAPIDPKSFNSPQDEEKAIGWVNANVADPNERKAAEGYVRGIANTNRQIINQEHAAAVKQATDWWFQHGNSIANLPADVKMQLSPEDIDSFSQQAKAKNDVDLMASWIEHPEEQTVDAVKQAYAQGRLSDNGYLRSLNGAMALQEDPSKADRDKVRAVTVDNGQINNTLIQNGFQNLATPGPKDVDAKAQKVRLVENIKDQIDAAQMASKKVLTWQEKQEIIDRTLSDSAFIDQSHFFGAATAQAKRVYFMTPQELGNAYENVGNQKVYLRDIPAEERQSIITALNRRKMPVTQQSIAQLWVQAGKPGAKQ